MNKNKILTVIVTVSMISVVFAGESTIQTEEPSVMKDGEKTVLIPGAEAIGEHLRRSRNDYEQTSEYSHFEEMNNVPVFMSYTVNGVIKKGQTLGQLRYAYFVMNKKKDEYLEEKDLVLPGDEGCCATWFNYIHFIKPPIEANNAVVCPNVVPQQKYSFEENIAWFFTGKEKAKLPAIVVTTRNCDICKQVEEYYKKQQ